MHFEAGTSFYQRQKKKRQCPVFTHPASSNHLPRALVTAKHKITYYLEFLTQEDMPSHSLHISQRGKKKKNKKNQKKHTSALVITRQFSLCVNNSIMPFGDALLPQVKILNQFKMC